MSMMVMVAPPLQIASRLPDSLVSARRSVR
jgi:hypothetical protein